MKVLITTAAKMDFPNKRIFLSKTRTLFKQEKFHCSGTPTWPPQCYSSENSGLLKIITIIMS